MVHYWQWVKGELFKWKSNKVFNKFIRIKSYAYILVIRNITVTGVNANTKVAFKNFTPFKKYRTDINKFFIDESDFISIAMSMYHLIEYSDNYSDSSGSLWQFKRDEIDTNASVCNANSSLCISSSSLSISQVLLVM